MRGASDPETADPEIAEKAACRNEPEFAIDSGRCYHQGTGRIVQDKGDGVRRSRDTDEAQDLQAGQKLRNRQSDMLGEILESACQYAHPKADPVYSYLIRWQDGQIQALSEGAFQGDYGVEIID